MDLFHSVFCLVALIGLAATPAPCDRPPDFPVIPRPAHVEMSEGLFRSGSRLDVNADPATLRALRRALAADGGPAVSSPSSSKSALTFTIERHLLHELGEEGYQISVRPHSIRVHAARPVGLLHAVQTLRQLAWAGGDRTEWVVPCCDIKDRPRFAWRGFMLDESRNFSGPDAVKRLLDAMELLKLNRFHWHLTDETAWRIEIQGLPKLTEIGSLTRSSRKDAKPEFYTQEQVREIVAYALERGIVIVPEINMPGHATAANRAYPEYSAGGTQKHPVFTFNPANEATFHYLETILRQVAEMFPNAGVLHLGGDEVDYGWATWPGLPEVKELMADEGLRDLRAVEAHFKRRMAHFVASLGMKAGFWMVGVEQGIPSDQVILFWWRHGASSELRAALERNCSVVLCPAVPCFFNFEQDSPRRAKNRRPSGVLMSTLYSVYVFPDSLVATLPKDADVLGVQANLWTEATASQEKRDLLTFPRLDALAEAAWTPAERKDYIGFEERLRVHLPRLRAVGITPWDPFATIPQAHESQ